MSQFLQFLQLPIASAIIAAIVAAVVASITIRVRVKERYLTKELKLSEYRQVWINGLRDALSQFGAKTSGVAAWEQRGEETIALMFQIQMMMNPDDPDYDELSKALKYRVDALVLGGTEKLDPGNDNLLVIGQRILKREWRRVKSDLDEVKKA